MTQGQQPEALRLADECDTSAIQFLNETNTRRAAAATIRRLHAENTTLQQAYDAARLEISGLNAARIAYANEFALNADGEPDVGNIHANIRSLKAEIESLKSQLAAIGAGGVEPLRSTQEWSYAGVKIWVGDKQARQITTQPAIENEGMTLTLLAQKCLDALGVAYRPGRRSEPQSQANSVEIDRIKTDHFRDATKMVPQGWKLVPNNSTTDMRIAYQRARDEGFESAYRAMLAAAPQPPADHLRDATKMIEKQPSKLSDSEIDAIAEAMPGGLDGFLKGWGWRQFARAVIGAAGGEDALDAAPQPPAQAAQGDAEQRAKDALDAARYRWLRDKSVPPHNFYISVPEEFKDDRYMPHEVDAYIDAARSQAQQGCSA